jgi:hypothetical protein
MASSCSYSRMHEGKGYIVVSLILLLLLWTKLDDLPTTTVTAISTTTTTTNSGFMTSNTHLRSLQNEEDVNEVLSPYYYDELRMQIENATIATINNTDTQIESPLPIVITQENSTIYQVTLSANSNETNDEVTYRFVELKSFIAFTAENTSVVGAQNEAFAVLLAMYHFNNMVPLKNHPVLGAQIFDRTNGNGDDDNTTLSSCNVKLTIELLDSTYSPTIATQTIASVLERTTSISVPPTTALVSSSPTTVTLPLAILTGINDIPVMSGTATATGFDDLEQFPIFGRTVTNAEGIAAVSLKFFQTVIRSSHIAILFVTVRCDKILSMFTGIC